MAKRYAAPVRSSVRLAFVVVSSSCALGVIGAFAPLPGCSPRHPGGNEAVAPTTSASPKPTATPTPTTTATGTVPSAWTLPGFNIPGLPGSPRQAIIGKWNVAAIDGKPIATAPGMATDPMDPASYAAGSTVVFTADNVTIARATTTMFNKPYKVVSEQAPIRVTIDAGYGPSNIDFAIDGSAVWSLPSTPPHALSLTRAQ